MGIVTYYARMTALQVQDLTKSSETLVSLPQNVPPGGEFIEVDKAAEIIAWLLSPCKRAEQIEFAAIINEEFGEDTPPSPGPRPIPPLDEFAICIEGRGPKKLNGLDTAYGPACEFQPEEVKQFSAVLDNVDESVLRRELNFELMDTLHLPVEYWQEEGEETFTKYIVPQFEKLKRFYKAAANAGQSVLVWHS